MTRPATPPRLIRRVLLFLLSYPRVGRAVSTLLGALEVPLLDTISFLEQHTRVSFCTMMRSFTRVYGSRVIPLDVTLGLTPVLSPTEEVLQLVQRVESLAIGYCYCRTKYRNCQNELWTCIHVGTAQSITELSRRLPMRPASLQEVEDLIRRCDRAGLVHQLITAPTSQYVYVICNCCPCCCVMLRSAIRYGVKNTALASSFISEVDFAKCTACGECVRRCHFGARQLSDKRLTHIPELCSGCGLCVSSCAAGATRLVRRQMWLQLST
ncbi:MAG: hypothetical protein HXY34_03500 [Candidatus Thorarchaeota archaeon]|nr:hypothetical protein [Candidatus Thorarchaeota archaeon]